MVKLVNDFSEVYKDTVSSQGFPLPSCWYFSETLPSNAIKLGVRISAYEFGERLGLRTSKTPLRLGILILEHTREIDTNLVKTQTLGPISSV